MNLQSMHSKKIFSNLNDFKDGKLKPNQKLRLFIDLVILQVCFLPFFSRF